MSVATFGHPVKTILQESVENGIENEIGCEIFDAIVNSVFERVIVSKGNLQEKILYTKNQLMNNSNLHHDTVQSELQFDGAQLEEKLLSLWHTFFSNDTITSSDDFTQLGGDSLSAIELTSKIKLQLGIEISPYKVLENRNVENLAAFLSKDINRNAIKLVDLRTVNQAPTLICIHPGHGAIIHYKQLFELIDTDISIYAIENHVLTSEKFASIDAMAKYYVNLLSELEHLEKGVLLAGWSLGGTVAYAMTKKLQDKNIPILHLALFDAWANYTPRLRNRNFFDSLQANSSENSNEWLECLWHYTQLLLNYQPIKLSCNCTLFKAQKLRLEYQDVADPYNGWQPYLKKLPEVIQIPGDHQSMMNFPNLRHLADNYGEILNTLKELTYDCYK